MSPSALLQVLYVDSAMELALIISLIALVVALPGCVADSLTLIEKARARRAKLLLKKSSKRSLDYVKEPNPWARSTPRFPNGLIGTREEIIKLLARKVPREIPDDLKKAFSS